MDYLAKFMENYLGPETLLFSTDGSSMGLLQCGTTKKAFATVDFGTPKSEHNLNEIFLKVIKLKQQSIALLLLIYRCVYMLTSD